MYTVNSADSHVVETDEFWREWLPVDVRDDIVSSLGLPTTGPLPQAADIHPGAPRGGSPDERIKDLDEDGVWGEVLFPNMGVMMLSSDHYALRLPFARAYNDWVTATYHATNSKRFAPVGLVPIGPRGDERIDEAVAEVHRIAKKGLRSIMVPATPALHRPYSLPMYDPIWTACVEHGLVLTCHIGTSAERFFPEWEDLVDAECSDPASWATPARPSIARPCPEMPPGAHLVTLADSCLQMALTLGWFAAGGVLDRYPKLHVVCVEGGAGWLAWLMDNLDTFYYARFNSQYPKLKEKPSHYLRHQTHVTFENDSAAVANLEHTGIEPLLWSTDYPHEEGSWPNTQQVARRLFSDVDDTERVAMMAGTTGALFGLEIPLGAKASAP